MSVIHLYRIPQVIVLTSETGASLMNYPMNRTDFTLHRHADNDIDILVKDIDRTAISFANASAVITVIDPRQQRLLLSRQLTVHDAAKGHLKFFLTGDEVAALPIRDLTYTVTMTRPDNAQVLLYTDRDRSAKGIIHIEEGSLPLVVDPVHLDIRDFFQNGTYYQAQSFASAKTSGNESGIHSLTLELLQNFSGKFEIQGSTNPSAAQDDSDWKTILTRDYTEVTGVQYLTFTDTDILWVRFRITPRRGKFDKIVYRN